ncbi:MAG: hypothetical protein ACJ762_07810 [Solirubrobacteraceae bacterium]
MRAALWAAVALAFACAAPAGAYEDRFLPPPDNCHAHPTTHGIHHIYVGARYVDCDAARHVVSDWLARHAECHKTGYCRVLAGGWTCHTTFESSSYHTHCTWLYGAGETFTAWKRV